MIFYKAYITKKQMLHFTRYVSRDKDVNFYFFCKTVKKILAIALHSFTMVSNELNPLIVTPISTRVKLFITNSCLGQNKRTETREIFSSSSSI